MIEISLDLETLGTRAGSVIVSIGAVAFAKGAGIQSEFYAVPSIKDQLDRGMSIDASTLQWWLRQSEEARAVFKEPAQPPESALSDFTCWVEGLCGKEARIWGNGSDFDNALLAAMYHAYEMPVPWKFWNSRCLRTLQSLYPDKKIARSAGHHNALIDAREQGEHILRLLGDGD